VEAVSRSPALAASSRSLSTARAVLRVLGLLMQYPEGVRADEVAHELGKSTSTAYYLLTSLCEEGYAVHASRGVYRAARGLEALAEPAKLPKPARLHPGDHDCVPAGRGPDELFRRTRKRSYLGVVKPGRIEIVAIAGRQGVRRMPGLGAEIRDSAHALAMGKVILALFDPARRARYLGRGLRSFTEHTITDADVLSAELDLVRRRGFAVDREEFDEDFCCIAAPVFEPGGPLLGVLGLSVGAHVFDAERDELAEQVVAVAGPNLQENAENPVVLVSDLSAA
jgi:DNA-binding IclR family transcriptional regulator